jgi:hypothetical protein
LEELDWMVAVLLGALAVLAVEEEEMIFFTLNPTQNVQPEVNSVWDKSKSGRKKEEK